jgi:hypothetical protein
MDAHNVLLHIHPLTKFPFPHPVPNGFHPKQTPLHINEKVLDYAYYIKHVVFVFLRLAYFA